MTLKLLSEWDETFYALLLKSFMIEAVPYLWDSCSVAPFVRHQVTSEHLFPVWRIAAAFS